MGQLIRFPERNTPRWLILVVDIIIAVVSLQVAYLLRFNFRVPGNVVSSFVLAFPIVVMLRIITYLLGRTYAGIVRYTGTKDTERIFLAVSGATALLFLVNFGSYFLYQGRFVVPTSVVVIDWLACIFLMVGSRLLVKFIHQESTRNTQDKSIVVIFGAGEAGSNALRALRRDVGKAYEVQSFLDDDLKKVGHELDGVPIRDARKLETYLRDNPAELLIIAVQDLPAARKREVIEAALRCNTRVLSVPPVAKWIDGELSFNQIRKVKIEDLLERDPIVLDRTRIGESLKRKSVLVTGAAGSIGSELVRQIAPFGPALLIMLDQAESPLYEMELEVRERFPGLKWESVLCDVSNERRMQKVFNHFKIDVVFHAAAYKHVPMMESNPAEAVMTNVGGTRILADLAVKHGIQRFVFVSTDKAVNPTNVMGASKRAAETYCQSLGRNADTRFITTRFGNVLGSNGSVIPLFTKQIERGGPVTVTHPDVTRYFMTIPEASQLVLEAGALGNGGEIFVFDMGNPVKIYDLAKKMVALSGLELDRDIKIEFSGMRPGEKLYEELLNSKENTLPTHHPRILIGKVREYEFEAVRDQVDAMLGLVLTNDNMALVSKLKALVPEFKSENSEFSSLDG